MVFNHLIGVQNIGANLASPFVGHFFRVELVLFTISFFHFLFVESGFEHLKGLVFVGVLASLVLALDHNPTGPVGDADGGVRFIDMLAPRSTGSIGVDPQILSMDVDVDVLIDLGPGKDGGKTGVPSGVRVKGADANKAVHSRLGLEGAIGVGSLK